MGTERCKSDFCHPPLLSTNQLRHHHVRHCPSLRLSPPQHGCLEEHEARHRAGHQPHPHLRCQAGHCLCCQVHWSRSCHRGSCWIWCWYRLRFRVPHYRLRQEPVSQAAAVLLRHLGICSVRGYGSLLFDDGLPSALRFLNEKNNLNPTWCIPSTDSLKIKC